MSENKKQMFGITSETKATNSSPLLVATKVEGSTQFPSGWKFPIARLVKIVFNPELEKKDGTTVPVLQFIFKDADGRQYMHTEWVVDNDDAKAEEKLEGMKVRIKHIYTSIFGKFPINGIGTDATSYADFFSKVEQAFSSIKTGEGEDAKLVYPTVNLYYKLTYYKDRLGFPLSPNFLEKVVKGKPCTTLSIVAKYDKVEPAITKGGGIPGLGAPSGEDLPSFDEEYV